MLVRQRQCALISSPLSAHIARTSFYYYAFKINMRIYALLNDIFLVI
jgi:hypothetical protein